MHLVAMPKLYSRTSVTLDEAIANLMGIVEGPVEFLHQNECHSNDTHSVLESLSFDLNAELQEQYEQAWSELNEAKVDKQPTTTITEMTTRLDKAKHDIELANALRCLLDDATLKLPQAITLDPRLSRPDCRYITLASLRSWAEENDAVTQLLCGLQPYALEGTSIEPWRQEAPGDPKPEQPWYTPARYFARELTKEDPSLHGKRELLASKISEKLAEHEIFKRGGKKPLASGTILKALSNVLL